MNIVKHVLRNQTSEGDAGAATAAPPPADTSAVAAPAATAPAATNAQAPTGDAAATPSASTPPATWPENWRQSIAGSDQAVLKRLERFNTPADIFNSFRSMEQKLSSGEIKPNAPFPDNGTPEQQAQWRKENGIPEAPDKYELKLREGVVIGDADKPVIDKFLSTMHGKNLPPAVASDVIQWYFDEVEAQAEARFSLDNEQKQKFEDTMRAEWGPEYRPNINAIKSVLDMGGEGMFDKIANSRMADGTPFGSSPEVMKWLALMARQINPTSTIVPAAGANIAQSVNDEIKQIEDFMRTNRREYDRDEKKQERLRQLYEYRDKGKAVA